MPFAATRSAIIVFARYDNCRKEDRINAGGPVHEKVLADCTNGSPVGYGGFARVGTAVPWSDKQLA